MSVLLMLMIGAVYTFSVFRPHIQHIYSLSTLESGYPYMISLFFYAFSMMVTGRILKPRNTFVILMTGTLMIGLGWILSGLSQSFIVFLLSYGVLIGIGVGMVYGIPIRGIQDIYPAKKGFFMGIILLGFGLSTLVVAPLSTYLIETVGIKSTFYIYGIAFLVMAIPFSWILKYRKINTHQESIETQIVSPLSITGKQMYLYFVIATTIGLMMIGLSYYIGVEVYQFDPWRVALSMSLFAFMNGISRPLFGLLMDRKGFYYSVKLSFMLMMIGAIISMLNRGTHLALFMISYSIFWFNLGAWLAIIPATVRIKYGSENYSKVYGYIFTGYGIGAILGTLLSGFIMDLFGDTFYIYLIIMIMIGSLFMYVLKTSKIKTIIS